MSKKHYTAEHIIVKLRKIEVLCGQGQTVVEAVRQAEITEQTYYRWRKQYGGMNTDDAKRLQMMKKENARLKKIVWENSYCESFNSRMWDEFLNGELFGSFYETEVLTKRWVKYYNEIRPHSSLGGKPPSPQSRVLGM